MSTRLQLRRGNTAQTAVFTGAIGEVTVDTDQKTLTVHDGVTVGGNYIVNKTQFDANLSIIQGVNNGQNTTITEVNQFVASAYDTANGANGLAAGAFNKANTNSDNITIVQGVDLTQNTRLNSIETVNSDQNTAITIIQGVNLGQNTTITEVNQFAQSAYDTANGKFSSTGGLISGDVSVTGNLTVTGETFYANVTNLNVDDSFVVLNANTVSSPVFDAGIEIDRGTANNVFLYWNEFDKAWEYTDDLQNNETVASQSYVGSSISTSITPVNQFAQSAYTTANGANGLAAGAYNTANGANGLAAGAYNLANTSLQNSGTQTLNGNLIVNGSTNVSDWSNTANAYVSNKLYAGIAPFLSTPLPDLIAQFTGNTENYVQVNAENIDPEGSADFVITADVGNDSIFYLDLGLHNSNRQFGATYPLDGYLIVQGNTGQIGGNLIIGTTSQTPGQHTKIIAGGGEESNVVIQFNDDLSTLFYGNAIPSVNNSQYLGSSTKRWKELFIGNSIDIDSVVLSNNNGYLTISGAEDFIISGSSIPSIGTISNNADDAYDKANGAYDAANSANGLAAGAYSQANTNAGAITIIEGVNLTQNNRLSIIEGVNLGQNNTITSVNNFTQSAFNTANNAYNQANTGTSIAEAAFAFANTLSGGSATDNVARTLAQSAYNSSNLVNQFAASAYDTANGANGLAAGAYNQANTNAGAITIIEGVNLGQNNTITSVNQFAQSAYDTANNKFNSSGGTISGDVAVTGNLSVTGTTFYANTEQLHVKDNIITLNSNVTGVPTLDAGIEVNRGSETNTVLKWSEVNHAWQFTNDGTNFFRIADTDRVNSAFSLANTNAGDIAIIQGVNLGQNTTITQVNQFSASAYDTANGANGLAAGAYNTANGANGLAVSAFSTANGANGLAAGAFDTANGANGLAASAFNKANTNADAITIIQGVNLGQNTTITEVNQFAASAFNTANGANGLAASAYDTANGANGLANAAFDKANTNYSYATQIEIIANQAYLKANGAYDTANAVNGYAISAFNTANGANGLAAGAFDTANGANGLAAGAFNTANGANGLANAAFNKANTNSDAITIIQGVDLTQNTRLNSIETINSDQNTAITIIQGVDLTQNTNITAVNNYAAAAFDKANTGGIFTGNVTVQQNLTVSQDLVVSGNLIISGNTTSVSANNLVVNDPLIVLANNNTTDVVDIGFIAHYDEISLGENRHTGVIRHAETNEYYIFYNYDKHVHANTGGNNVIDINDSSFLLSNVNAGYYKGNLIATTAVIGGTDVGNYINVTQGIDNTQNTRLNSVETVNSDQNTAITIIQGVDNWQNTEITAVNNYAAGAYALANTNATNISIIQGVDLAQNSAISIIQGVDLTQNTNITAVNNYAAGAYALANTALQQSGGTITGTLTVPTVILNNALVTSNTFTTSSTAQVTIDSFSAASYRSAKYQVQIDSGIEYHVIELRVVHDGANTWLAQYGEILTGSSLGTFDTDISGGLVRLQFTGTNSVSTIKLIREAINI